MADYLDPHACSILALAVASDGSIYPKPQQLFAFTGPFSQAAMLVSDLIGRAALLENPARAAQIAHQAIQTAEPVDFAAEIFTWLRIQQDEDNDGENERDRRGRLIRKRLPVGERQRLGLLLASRIKEELEAEPSVDNRTSIHFLSVWSAYTSVDVKNAFIADRIKADPSYVLRLLDGVRPTAWGMESGLSSKKMLDRHEYERLIKFADPEMIKRALEGEFGKYEPRERFPRDVETDPNRLLADQFLWLHRYVEHNRSRGESEAEAFDETQADSDPSDRETE